MEVGRRTRACREEAWWAGVEEPKLRPKAAITEEETKVGRKRGNKRERENLKYRNIEEESESQKRSGLRLRGRKTDRKTDIKER